jgi:lambda family phage portal protein
VDVELIMALRLPSLFGVFNRAQRRQHVRRFDGATGGRRGWGIGTFHSINPEVAGAGANLRTRARYQAVNHPFIANAVGNWVGALIGAGIMPTAKHSDSNTRNALGEFFHGWAEDADADSRTDLAGLLADIARALVIDGEAFIQLLALDGEPRVRLIPAELVDESMTRELGNGAMIVQGVEFDTEGRRVAYWIFPAKPTDQFATYAPPVRVPAEDIIHVMKPLAAGQVRGISWLAPVILPANEFDQIVDALAMGVKVAAMHAGFLIDQNGTAGEPYDGTGDGGVLETGLEPGTLKRLPTGVDVKFTTPQQANEVAAFLRFNLQMLAAGLGLPEHLLSGDLTNANYSSLRAGLLPFRQRVEQIQYGVLVPQLLRPIWRRVIGFAVLSGDIAVDDLDEAFRVEWIMPRPMQVDPEKDAKAVREMLSLNLMSRRQAVAELGWDIETLDAEIAADRARETALGIAPAANATKPEEKEPAE